MSRITKWTIYAHTDDDGLERLLVEGENERGVVLRVTACDHHHACVIQDALRDIEDFEVVLPDLRTTNHALEEENA